MTCSGNYQNLYIDGVLSDSNSQKWMDIGTAITKVQIGGNGDGKFPVAFNGKVDNVGVFTSALSSAVVKYLFDNKL